jgi:hypothetical protein
MSSSVHPPALILARLALAAVARADGALVVGGALLGGHLRPGRQAGVVRVCEVRR